MKYWFSGILLLISVATKSQDTSEEADNRQVKQRPNVIIVLTDDQGYGDLSCHGNPVLQTPALDRLHDESIRLVDFHATPLCTPTRGELMTGLDAMRNRAATVGRGLALMRRDIPTMPEIFRENGYATGIFGKWHLGDNYPDRPMDRGFEKCVWIKGWGLFSETEYDNDYYRTRYLDSLQTRYSDKYCTNLWFDEAMSWMEEMSARKEPFFTYLALNAPHGPFDAPKQDADLYRGKVEEKVASFYGMIRNIDHNMARLEAWLVKKGLRDNTLLIFMTDNGSAAGAGVYNAGMRGEKGSNYEGGHRVPCFIRWPAGQLRNAGNVTAPTQVQDILPTLIDLMALKTGGHQFDGVSLAPVLRKKNAGAAGRMFVVQYAGLEDLEQKYSSAVVWNSWRLVGEDELYDVGTDPGQKHNVAAAHPEVLKRMKNFYEGWWKEISPGMSAQVPLIVGAKENPVILSSDYWTGRSINTYWKVAAAEGAPQGGAWPLRVVTPGRYRLQLSRWPFHLERKLTAAGPRRSVGGKELNPGKALPIVEGCLALDGEAPLVIAAGAEATELTVELALSGGDHQLQAWFRDSAGQDLCGAYYLRIERLEEE